MTDPVAKPPPIAAVPTSIGLLVGWSPSGPTDRALRVSSLVDYERNFGALDSRSLLGHAIRHFFDNGGKQAYALRVAGAAGAAIGPADAAFLTALQAAFAAGGPADRIDIFNLLCVPGLTDVDATVMLQAYVAARGAFLIADCGADETAATIVTALGGKTGANAAHSALFFPWVMAVDPLQADSPRAFPPSGFVAGIFARTDSQRGVWRPPAGDGAHLEGAVDLAVHIDDATQQRLNPHAVNCLRSFPATGAVVFGSRTLDGDDSRASDWKYIPVRRMASFIERSVLAGVQWAVFELNAEPLWATLRQAVGDFMHGLFLQGAFQGTTPAQAYVVRCDATTTTQADIDRGDVNIVIGFAPLKPAEFVLIRIGGHAGGSS